MLAFLQRITFSAPVTGKVAAAKDWRQNLFEDEPLILVGTGSPPDHRKDDLPKVSRLIIIVIIVATTIITRYVNENGDSTSLNSWRLPGKGAWSRKPMLSSNCNKVKDKHQRWNISLIEE